MVMSSSPTTHPPSPAIAPAEYARPLGHRLSGKFHRMPLVLAGLAIASLLLPLAQADAAVIEPVAQDAGIAAQAGLQPVAQQREGRRGGGEFRGNRGGGGGGREFRGGGRGREFRAQNRSAIGSARIATPREYRQERRGDRQDFRQERRGDQREFRQERRGDQRDFRQERRADRQDLRQGDLTRPEFRADRRDDRRDFRQDRRGDVRDFRTDRRDDRRDFRQDRRADNRDFRNDRRGWDDRRGFNNRGWNNGGWDNRGWNNRGGRGGNWDRGWRNDRRYDWVGFRNQNRNFFRAGRYFPPVRGWGYRRLGIGFTLGAPFFANNFWINDPWAYRLPPAYGQLRWVRYFGDVLLVDIYTGQVVDVIPDFFW